jgi:hypothetical protein
MAEHDFARQRQGKYHYLKSIVILNKYTIFFNNKPQAQESKLLQIKKGADSRPFRKILYI